MLFLFAETWFFPLTGKVAGSCHAMHAALAKQRKGVPKLKNGLILRAFKYLEGETLSAEKKLK